MAAKSVTHSATVTVGNVSLSLSDSSTATADPTDFVLGTFRADTSFNTIPAGDVDASASKVLLLIKNENTTGNSELQVCVDGTSAIHLVLLNGQTNLLSTENLSNIKLKAHTGTVDVSYMAVQIGANS
tara:strand:- start:48 stop:431 length:384 start_codon:yes stop_codon:yes gene_type:complete